MENQNTRGRKAAFADKFAKVAFLEALANGDLKSRYLALQLVEQGLVASETIKSAGRGRPRVEYKVTGKGRGYMALARNWKKTA